MLKYNRLDRRQAVRHWVLVPAFAGSNPADPATEIIIPKPHSLGIFCFYKISPPSEYHFYVHNNLNILITDQREVNIIFKI